MPPQPPTQVPCSAPGCSYNTPPHANIEEALGFLKLHIDMAHQREEATPQIVAKLNKLTQPASKRDMTEYEFKLFNDQWERYKRATQITGQIL